MSHELPKEKKLSFLRKRAHMLFMAREFFRQREILEVDCPALSDYPAIDIHIDPMETDWGNKKTSYLHTSPEYHMKRLLSLGIGDIYQLSHVFRKEEKGCYHHPEFTLVEWYRHEMKFEDLILETLDFIKLFLGKELPVIEKSYRQLFIDNLQIDPFENKKEILAKLEEMKLNNISFPDDYKEWDKDTLLAFLLTHFIEPKMKADSLYVIKEYPSSQAALSQVTEKEGLQVAERFEVYYQSIELANGYHELTDSVEQNRRFIQTNKEREQLGKEKLPIDDLFIKALEIGIDDCCGVAVGFDRLLMLQLKQESIHNILP